MDEDAEWREFDPKELNDPGKLGRFLASLTRLIIPGVAIMVVAWLYVRWIDMPDGWTWFVGGLGIICWWVWAEARDFMPPA